MAAKDIEAAVESMVAELLTGQDVIVVEDIVDSGMTLHYLKGVLKTRNAASVSIATLLDNLINLSDEDFVKGGGI